MTRMIYNYDPDKLYGYMKVFCKKCLGNYTQCRTEEAYKECVKYCEDCCGTTRIPIPDEEVMK